MTNTCKTLLEEIIAFCKANKMAISTFGRLSVNDGKLVSRLKNGKDVTLKTHKKIKSFMSKYSLTIQSESIDDEYPDDESKHAIQPKETKKIL